MSELSRTATQANQNNLTAESLDNCLHSNMDIDRILKPTKAKMVRSTIRHSRTVSKKITSTTKNTSPPSNPPATHVTYATVVTGSTSTSTLSPSDKNQELPENIQAMIEDAVQTCLNPYSSYPSGNHPIHD